MLARLTHEWAATSDDLWVFAYASLIWRPEQPVAESRPAKVHGYHRALQMWSRVNRGTPEEPGLVFALIAGGSCQGVVQRVARADALIYLPKLWAREMPNPVYDPKWLTALTPNGPVRALAFTLPRHSPSYTGQLDANRYRQIFTSSVGRYGSTLAYARETHRQLAELGIHDHALAQLLAHAPDSQPLSTPSHAPATAEPTYPHPMP